MIQISDERWEKVKEQMCDDFCIWPTMATNQRTLELHCEECPLNHVEYPLGKNDYQE